MPVGVGQDRVSELSRIASLDGYKVFVSCTHSVLVVDDLLQVQVHTQLLLPKADLPGVVKIHLAKIGSKAVLRRRLAGYGS